MHTHRLGSPRSVSVHWALGALVASATLASVGCQDIFGVGVGVPGDVVDAGADAGPDGAVAERCRGAIAADDAWACLTEVACEFTDRCFGDTFGPDDCLHTDLELYGVSLQVGEALMAASIADGTIEYDPAGFGACLDFLRTLDCHDLNRPEDPFDQCGGFVGVVPDGGECTFDRQCAPLGSRCEAFGCGDQVCCPGNCVAAAPVGGSCGETGLCVAGAHCVGGTCTDGRAGDLCFGSSDCDLAFWCEDGACAPDLPSGSAGCFDDAACPYPETCIGLDLSFPALGLPTGTCGRSIDTGDPCDGECSAPTTHFCDAPEPGVLGTCTPVGKRDQACDPSIPLTCEVGLICDEKVQVCVPSGDVGDFCFSTSDCWQFGRFCSNEIDGGDTGNCSLRQPDGQDCTSNDHCASGVCQDGSCAALDECVPIIATASP